MPSETYTTDTDWTVPANITRVQIEVSGQEGETSYYNPDNDPGKGGRVVGELPVSGGDTLYLRFPNDGGPDSTQFGAGAGGNSADVRYGGTGVSDRVAVAAGGGGEGQKSGGRRNESGGGDGGPNIGQDGGDGYGGGGGEGGSQSSGGAGDGSASDGSFGQGGGGSSNGDYNGGGGGGGYYGGGGGGAANAVAGAGGAAGGGGGGSNYVGGLDTVTANERGTSTSREITLTYTPAPTNLSADTVRYRSADLSWDSVSGADSYVVYRDGTEVGTTTTTSFTDTGLSPTTGYSWEVATVSSGSESGKSNTATGTTGGSAPSGVSVSESGTDVTLTWTDTNGDEDGYEIHRAQSPGVDTSGAPLATTAANAESYTDTNPAEGRDYWYRVVAVRNGERGNDSAEREIMVPLPAPTGLTVDDVRDADADLSWTTNTADADAHRVYVKEGDGRTGMSFDEADEVTKIGTNQLPDSADEVTLLLWAEVRDGNNSVVIDTVDDNSNRFNIHLPYSGGTWFWDFGAIGGAGRISGPWDSAWDGNVRHYAFRSAVGVGQSFAVDGTVEGSDADADALDTTALGTLKFGNDFSGDLFSARLYDRRLSDQEVSDAYNGNPPNDYVGYWPFDLNLSGVTPDVSGNGNDGTVNGPTLTGPALTDATGTLSGSTTTGTPSGLLNGQLYEAYLHAETADATVRDQ